MSAQEQSLSDVIRSKHKDRNRWTSRRTMSQPGIFSPRMPHSRPAWMAFTSGSRPSMRCRCRCVICTQPAGEQLCCSYESQPVMQQSGAICSGAPVTGGRTHPEYKLRLPAILGFTICSNGRHRTAWASLQAREAPKSTRCITQTTQQGARLDDLGLQGRLPARIGLLTLHASSTELCSLHSKHVSFS